MDMLLVRKKGHKSPQCPQKGNGAKVPTPTFVKKDKTQVRVVLHRPRLTKETNVVRGKVGCSEVEFVLDTGALISVVPEELVEKKQMLCETIIVVDANDGEVRRPLASVWIHVKGMSSKQTVAVATLGSLKGKALLAINIHNPKELKVLLDSSTVDIMYDVRAVQSRAEFARREWERAEEEELMSIEQPRCRVPTSGMSVSPVVERSVSAGHQSPTMEKTLPTSSHVSPVVGLQRWSYRV